MTLRSGFPIRKSTDQSLFAAPHSLSQRTTSFIACACQGIHQMPFRHLIVLIITMRQPPVRRLTHKVIVRSAVRQIMPPKRATKTANKDQFLKFWTYPTYIAKANKCIRGDACGFSNSHQCSFRIFQADQSKTGHLPQTGQISSSQCQTTCAINAQHKRKNHTRLANNNQTPMESPIG